MRVDVRLFAAAKAAVGRASSTLELPDRATLGDLIDAVPLIGDEAEGRRVLRRCSFLHNGVSASDTAAVLADGDRVDLLPPFAGG